MTRSPRRLLGAHRPLTALALLLAVASPLRAEIDLDATQPADPAFVTGVLPNGLTYFIRANEKPADRVELRLALRVGSVQEEESERGLAHFCEHMSFNGTERFPPGELVNYLESIGARFGSDSNAYTSYDQTVYFLQVPTDTPGALEKGLTIMADWAGRATLATEEIEKERGVVADELRGSKGAGKRIRDEHQKVLWHGSRYAERLPIGLESVIMNASPETIRAFYHRWYRPENAALIVVGALDPQAMEKRVQAMFGELPTTPAAERVAVRLFDVPPHGETLYSVKSDPELTASTVSINYKHPDAPATTGRDQRSDVVDSVAGYLLTLRLAERSQSDDPPFLRAGGGVSGGFKTVRSFRLSARARDGEVPRAVAALMEELARAREFGFQETELARARETILASVESRYAERDQRRSRQHASAAIRSYLSEEPLTSAEHDYAFSRQVIPGIGLAEVHAALRRLTEPTSRVVLVSAPEKEGAVPTVEALRAVVEPEEPLAVAAYVDDTAGQALMEAKPKPGRVVGRREIPELGVHELELSNGVRVIMKPTDFRNDQIRLTAWKLGGATELPVGDWDSAWRADGLVYESGLGPFTAVQLNKVMAGKLAGAGTGISHFMLTARGNATPKDVETMFQLLHLRFTAPAFREDAFRRLVDREVESIRNELNSPQGVYSRAWSRIAYDDHPLYRPTTEEEVRALRREDLERTYRQLFADADGWTFLLVGNVDPESHVGLVETYLASLPSNAGTAAARAESKRRPAYLDLDLHMPRGRVAQRVEKGVEDQARTAFMIWAPYGLDPDESFRIGQVTELLRIRLRERLREERGDTYGVSVGSSTLAPYPDYGRITISWGSSPDVRASMLNDVKDEIALLKKKLASAEDIAKLKELRLSALEEGEKENGWWTGQLRYHYQRGLDPKRILGARERIESIDAKTLRRTARRWLKLRQTAEVYLVPEGWNEGGMAGGGDGEQAAPALGGL